MQKFIQFSPKNLSLASDYQFPPADAGQALLLKELPYYVPLPIKYKQTRLFPFIDLNCFCFDDKEIPQSPEKFVCHPERSEGSPRICGN